MLPVTDRPVAAQQAQDPAASRGRGLVIAGSILVGLYLLPALAMLVWFVWGLVTAPEAMSMVFPFWFLALLVLSPVWVAGIALLGAGRSQQRGPVAGSVVAWVLALGGMPAIGFLLIATESLLGTVPLAVTSASVVALLISIPLLTVLALLSGAWLIWGKPRVA